MALAFKPPLKEKSFRFSTQTFQFFPNEYCNLIQVMSFSYFNSFLYTLKIHLNVFFSVQTYLLKIATGTRYLLTSLVVENRNYTQNC